MWHSVSWPQGILGDFPRCSHLLLRRILWTFSSCVACDDRWLCGTSRCVHRDKCILCVFSRSLSKSSSCHIYSTWDLTLQGEISDLLNRCWVRPYTCFMCDKRYSCIFLSSVQSFPSKPKYREIFREWCMIKMAWAKWWRFAIEQKRPNLLRIRHKKRKPNFKKGKNYSQNWQKKRKTDYLESKNQRSDFENEKKRGEMGKALDAAWIGHGNMKNS